MSEALEIMKSQIGVTMLGEFSLRVADRKIEDKTGRSKQLWTLLEYLIANRKNHISQEKLIEILWDDDECDNPANALKNLVYRVRNLINSVCDNSQCKAAKNDYIVYKRNVYSWNNDLPCVVDIEEFESAFNTAKTPELTDDEKMRLYSKAVDLYKGDFLPKSSSQYWVIVSANYYKDIYIKCVKNLCTLLLTAGRNNDAALVCEKAVVIEPFDEGLNELLINIYLKSGEQQKAIIHYENTVKLFYEKLGVKLSESTRMTMRNVIKAMNGVEKDLEIIKEDLNESQKIEKAYYCDYEIFKNIHRIEARLAERFGQSVFVALLTLEYVAPIKQQDLNEAMLMLKCLLLCSLRKSDVVSRYSCTQYILMLPSLTYENGQMVLERIVSKFCEQNKSRNIRVSADLKPLTPILDGYVSKQD